MSTSFAFIIVPIVKWITCVSTILCIIYLFVDHYETKKEIRELEECECVECNLDTADDISKIKNEEKKTRKQFILIIITCLVILTLVRLF